MFDENKVMPTTEELMAGAAADHVYEAIKEYVDAHPNFGIADMVGLLATIPYSNLYSVIIFLFKDGPVLRSILDKLKDIVWILERDNDWLEGK